MRGIDEIRNRIKELVTLSGREIISELEQEDQWILQVKHGNFAVSIVHPKNRLTITI